MTGIEHARQVLDNDSFGLARAAGQSAPPLSDEQLTRIRLVLAEPAAEQAA